ncbi:MAG: SCO family protein [Porticoccaceae bacterium]|nr:SCO family protein [Porticoccaceae bacterium]
MKSQTLKRGLLTVILSLVIIGGIALIDYLTQLGRSEGTVPPGTEAQIGGVFSLINQFNEPVDNESYADRYKLIFFGFTNCPDVCPTTLSRMTQALNQLGPLNAKLYPLFITVDPERDTPARLHEYAKAFDPRIIYLTGSSEEIAKVLKAWKANRAKIATEKGEATEEDYSMSHSSVLYLMTPDDRLVESYNWDIRPDKMVESINEWLEQ